MSMDKADIELNRWSAYYGLMMQRASEKEIEDAVANVKKNTFPKDYRKRRKRGYWTPLGFYWFRRKKRHVKNRFNSRGTDRGQGFH